MKKILLLILCMLGTLVASAALTTGYYKIQNPGYSRYMYEDFSTGGICTSTTCADTDYEKIWKLTVSGSTVTMQNVYTGHYAQTQNSGSTQFQTGSTAVSFDLTDNGDGTYMFKSGSYMHCAATQSYYVVNWWDASSTYSMWQVESVSLTDSEVSNIRSEYTAIETMQQNASSYSTDLLTFFTDLSCSELNSTYKSYTDANLKKAMANKSLPTGVQEIAVKVKNGTWEGASTTDLAKQFRVREYKPYTRAWYWRDQLRATQFTDMNNPTGIYADSKDVLYVFVGGDIPSGCELRIVGLSGNNQASFAAGTELHTGMNVLQAASDFAHQWIMYSYTGDSQVDMSTLASLKIHIEGGKVYGFADVAGLSETAANAAYKTVLDNANTVASANSATTTDLRFVVKGERGVFYFPLDTYNQIWKTSSYNGNYTTNYNIYKSIHWFDNVLAWEWGIMGFTKRVYDKKTDEHEHVTGGKDIYPTYCNNLALTVQNAAGTNPYSTTGYTSMPGVGGVESSYNAERADFDNWCVGHESGHNNQGAINLPSCTESSNNLFSNVVCYLHGYRMSRGEPVSTTNSDYQKGVQFALRDIGSTHRMYWQLYLYYHEAQRKTDFYPTLFELLREDGMNLNSGQCFLKFYQKACEAAGEDLTEYFRGWGFFEAFESTTFGDYTSRTLTLTQSEIDAAIASVKAKGYKENTAIMFIDDRIEESLRWDAWANGTTDKRAVQSHAVGSCGELGSVNDYTPNAVVKEANYSSYSLAGNTLTMNGTGGEGFLVYDSEGNLVAFSNSTSFTIPEEAIAKGFTVKVVNANNTTAEVKSVAEGGTTAEKLAALQEAITQAQNMQALCDQTNTKVGYFKSTALETLNDLVSTAQSVVSNTVTSRYGEMLDALNTEMAALSINDKAKIALQEGNLYALQNYVYTDRIATDSSDKLATVESSTPADTEKWLFVSTGNEGEYYLMNKSTQKYLSSISQSTQAQATAETTDDALLVKLEEVSQGVWNLSTGSSYGYLHCDAAKNIVGWTAAGTASHWYIQLAEQTAEGKASEELQEIIDKTESLLDRITESYSATGSLPITLTTTEGRSGYITTNAQESTEGDISNLIDASDATYFHTQWSGTGPDEDHYIQIDLADETLDQFKFSFVNRKHATAGYSGEQSPTTIVVSGSNDGQTFTEITTISEGMPTTIGQQSTYESAVLGEAGKSYRYLRFTVTATNTNKNNNGHIFFALGDFKLYRATNYILDEEYAALSETPVSEAISELATALSVQQSGTATEKTTEASALQAKYDALVEAINTDVKADLKAQIEALAEATNTLLGKAMVGDYTYQSTTGAKQLTLQTTQASEPFYVTSNHEETTEGPIKNLVDGDASTFFHSTWSAATTDKHYWQVNLGDESLTSFNFTMTSRNNNPNNFPSDVTVSGSTDGTNFTDITTLTNSLATSGSVTYTSGIINTNGITGTTDNSGQAYNYLRFTVNQTGSGNGNNTNATYYFFALSEFTLSTVTQRGLSGTKNSLYDLLTDDIVIDAADKKDQGTALVTEPSYTKATVEQLKLQLEALQQAHDALQAAMVIKGDINLDGKLNLEDATVLVEILKGKYTKAHGETDVNNSGTTDKNDVQYIIQKLLDK